MRNFVGGGHSFVNFIKEVLLKQSLGIINIAWQHDDFKAAKQKLIFFLEFLMDIFSLVDCVLEGWTTIHIPKT